MPRLLAALIVLGLSAMPAAAVDLRNFDDAPLHAVQFVDANEGWAVGDEGVVWHSIDGGRHWERQPTGTRASLRALHFVNPYTGWAVGRQELPEGGSVGVVLATRDGGIQWHRVSVHALPGLQCVCFFDDKNGVAAGDGSDQFPSGIFSTEDGGRTWKPVAGPRCPGWQAADFQNQSTGALAGAWSRLATVRQGNLNAADVDTLGGRAIHGLKVTGARAVAVGQGGLVLLSANTAGVRWGFANLGLPTEVLANLDFHAVACKGDQIWAVGRPGSVVLHSADKGQTWKLLSTGQPLPLHGVCFLNEQKGWAVGELGTVLATQDGGQTWEVQRQGGQRAAVLCVHGRPAGVPLETIALVGGEDGYLTATLQVTSADPGSAPPARAADPQRLTAAVRGAGGAAADCLWQFPVPRHIAPDNDTDLAKTWDNLHAGRSADQLLRQLVLALRVWKPEVVLLDRPETSDDALNKFASLAMTQAFNDAADPKAFPEQIEKLGLKPWKAAKLYQRGNEPGPATKVRASDQLTLDLNEVKPRIGGTARDLASLPAALLSDVPAFANQAFYRLVASRLEGAEGHTRLMQGIVLAEGGTARRELDALPDPDPDLEKALRTRRNLQALVEAPAGPLNQPNQLLSRLGKDLEGMPDDQGAAAAFGIASQFARNGQWVLAREAFLLMVDRYPAHPLSRDSYRWLVRHNCSSEARRRQELGQFLLMTETEIRQSEQSKQPNVAANPVETVARTQVAPLQASARRGDSKDVAVQRALGDLAEARAWYKGALEFEPRLAAYGRYFATEAPTQFCLQAARRQLGDFEKARDWHTRFLVDRPEGPWRDAAAAELWLANRQGPPPKPVAQCRLTGSRPFLDGNLDDACWQGLPPLKLRNAAGETAEQYPTAAWLAYDREYLYLAVRCQHPAGMQVPPVQARQRDQDLRGFDRISLLLDLDRDYSTYFQLQIDQRGCLAEDCWGDRTWNPRWFVAVKSDSTSWQVEAAIPLTELTGETITIGKAWSANVVRTLPGRGVQAWSTPADVEPRPEGMGILLFGEQQRAGTPAPVTRMQNAEE